MRNTGQDEVGPICDEAPRPLEPRSVVLPDGRRLETWQRPALPGAPTVIFENGLGSPASAWGAVVDRLAHDVGVVRYHRAGIGASSPDQRARTVDRLAEDLIHLVDTVDGPLVLTGHSWGGPILRTAAPRRPDRIVGVVLVDPSDEALDIYLGPFVVAVNRATNAVLGTLAASGITRLLTTRWVPPPLAESLGAVPEAYRAEFVAFFNRRANFVAYSREADNIRASMLAMRAHPPAVVPVATVTISAGQPATGFGSGNRQQLIAAHAERAAAAGAAWAIQPAPESGHNVPMLDPGAVVAAIDSVLGRG